MMRRKYQFWYVDYAAAEIEDDVYSAATADSASTAPKFKLLNSRKSS